MERIYLNVSPEEYSEAKAAGAAWDDVSKSWYIEKNGSPELFTRWLGDQLDTAQFGIVADEVMVVAAQIPCAQCQEDVEVICIYGESGVDIETGGTIEQFTVSNIWAVDTELEKKLERWPTFRRVIDGDSVDGVFANHCPHCNAAQDDYLLHSEPGDVFFGISSTTPGSLRFTRLAGCAQLSGDYGFEV
jgi:hypothetical protein